MGSHVDPKVTSCCAREVALCANKGLLSAVNSHVDFQFGRSVTRVATLVAIVILLCIKMYLLHVKLVGHTDISLFLRVLQLTMFWVD